VRSSKQTYLLAYENRKAFRFSVLTETKRYTGPVRIDKRNRDLVPRTILRLIYKVIFV